MVINTVMLLNAYPDAQGIYQELFPRELILRWQLASEIHCKAQFGSYCVAYDEPDANETNKMQDRDRRCINLGLTGNFQGTHKFLDLDTKRVINANVLTKCQCLIVS